MALPGLSVNEKRYFLGIKGGKITYRPGRDAEPETYDIFQGELKSIIKREASINGAPTLFYDITFMNSGLTYVLSVPMAGSVARSIILSLASVPNFHGKVIRISPYLKDGKYTNVSVYSNGERVKWVIEKLPDVKTIVIGGKTYSDDSERIQCVENYVNVINDRLRSEVDPETGEVSGPVVDVEQDDFPGDSPENLG